ncbi:MAG: hypothetical protein ACE15C_08290 [Phycisphaerae bacterium]
MKGGDEVVNPDERIVKVRPKVGRAFHAIRDVFLGYWRSTEPPGGHAWTRDPGLRARFATRAQAMREMKAVWRRRREAT